ncbi:hypothetical protein BJY00DRAFT_316101 [Aspergillus carlsbadensis]|nr:hypothetical protein BJY00DRAFT_316101 [Aspergillus carlsbadensis]
MVAPSNRAGFQIALITAVPTEYDATYELFDEIYDVNGTMYGKILGDANIYTTGKMGKYNVVLVCLADIGKMHAAQAVSTLRTSYVGIKYVISVGICGGAPYNGNHPIYLGDVIISTRLIEYDYGRNYPGIFKLKDTHLKTHNLQVEGLITHFRTTRNKAHLRTRVIEHLAKLPPQYSRPPAGVPDILYKSEYVHRHHEPISACICSDHDICDLAIRQTCDQLGCEDSQVRRRRELAEQQIPEIHLGPMASADQVLKSGVDRDRLTQAHHVLGFEMEGAGLWDGILSCTVIKGVCDYGDSHKKKMWQNYAAGAGAAATKAILEQLPPMADDECIKDCSIIPFERNTCFTGRLEELNELEKMISTPDGPRKFAVTGLGGIGKSQIALEVAYRFKDSYAKRPVFWIPCTSFETIEQGFVGIVRKLDLRKSSPAEAKETVQAHLSHKLTKWLLILDNVDDKSIWDFLEKVLPRSDQGRILVTTRTWQVAAKVAGAGGSAALKKIEQPSEETAMEMLKTRLFVKELVNETKAATALLRRLTCLPLAITQAAAYINQTGPHVTLSDYLRLLDNQEQEVVKLLSEDFRDETRYVDAPNPVASTWLVSFEQIQKSNFSAAQFLSLMACVDPCRIPRDFLPSLASDRDKVEALGLLSSFSFITIESQEGPITVHRLVHLATRNWMRKNRTFSGYRQQAVELMEKTMFDAHMGNQPLVRPSLPHAMTLLNETLDDWRIHPGDLFHLTAVSLYHEERYQEARTVLERLLLILEEKVLRVSGDDDPAFMLTVKALMVDTYIGQAQLDKAEELGLYVFEQRKQLLGIEHDDTLKSMNQLSGLYRMQERWAEAMPLYLQLLDIHRRRRSRGDDTTPSCLNDLVETFRALGNWKEAEKTQLQALEIARDALGPDHQDYLLMMNSLVNIYLKQGRYTEARPLAKKVVDGASKDSKLCHLQVASLVALAACYNGQGEWEQAEDFAVQAIAKSEEVLGRDHPLNLTTVDLLARIYLRQKKWKAAEAVGAPAVDTAKKLYGPRNSKTLNLMAGLALAYRHQGQWPEAEEIESQVFDAHMDTMGLGHSHTLASMDKLQEIYIAQGRGEEAARLKERSLKIEVKARERGLEDPEVLENMHKLALTWHGLGRVEDARELMARTIRLRKEYNQQPSYNDRPAYGAGYNQNPFSSEQNSYELSEDPTSLLNRCRDVNEGIRELKAKTDSQLAAVQNAYLDSNTERDDQIARQQLDYVEDEIKRGYSKLTDDLKRVKASPGSNATHVQNQIDVTGRNLRNAIDEYGRFQLDFQRRLKEQVRRRYQIANPDASPEEIDQGVENVLAGTEQSFQVTGARMKDAQGVLSANRDRSLMIRKIEKDIEELASMMTRLEQEVRQQETAVENIHRDAGNVHQDLENANTQLTGAISSARKARRWKWYALIIVIIIIAIIVGVAVGVTAN